MEGRKADNMQLLPLLPGISRGNGLGQQNGKAGIVAAGRIRLLQNSRVRCLVSFHHKFYHAHSPLPFNRTVI